MSRPLVALLTDFGTRDWYAAAMTGVILTRAPQARIVSITHEIPPQDVLAGAVTLAGAAPWFPAGTVFVAVVDPGVGSRRALVAARAGGRTFIGPDNGLLTLALEGTARRRIVRLTNRRHWLPSVSRTFHGRDIMAPVAAFVARGGQLQRLGPAMRRLTPLPVPRAARRGRTVSGAVLHIDVFGNLITNLRATARQLEQATVRCRRRTATVVSSYADGRPKQLVAAVGSSGLVELAVRNGSAARLLRAARGERVTLERGRA